jgi:hypothetical protein
MGANNSPLLMTVLSGGYANEGFRGYALTLQKIEQTHGFPIECSVVAVFMTQSLKFFIHYSIIA